MGCFNVTCAISGLPITYKDEAVLITVVENNSYSSRRNGCYVTDHHFVRSLPVHGIYDDYGSIEKWEEGYITDLVLQQFQYRLIPHDEHKKHKDEFTLETMQEWLHRGTVFLKPLVGREDKRVGDAVNKLIIRKDVWDYLMGLEIEGWRGTFNLALYKQHAEEYLDSHAEQMAEINALEDQQERLNRITRMMIGVGEHDLLGKNWFYSHFEYNHIYKLDDSLGYYRNLVQEKFPSGKMTREQALQIYHRMAEVVWLETIMGHLRLSWHLVSGMGSQDANFEAAENYHLKMAEIAAAQQRKYEEY